MTNLFRKEVSMWVPKCLSQLLKVYAVNVRKPRNFDGSQVYFKKSDEGRGDILWYIHSDTLIL